MNSFECLQMLKWYEVLISISITQRAKSKTITYSYITILNNEIRIRLTKTTAPQNGVALSYRKVRGLYFLAVVFVSRIVTKNSIITIALPSTK